MDQAKQWSFALERFVVFLRDVIEPAVYSHAAPLDAGVHQSVEPIRYEQAIRARYTPVKPGFVWGPAWSTAWFRLRGRVPADMKGRQVALRFSTDTEALLWMPAPRSTRRGVPHHGLDVNRDAVVLFPRARGGERVDLLVEAACNHPFGNRGLQWDPPEIHRRWNGPVPGLFERAELAVRHEDVWSLRCRYAFALDLAKHLPPDSARAQQLLGVLRRVTNAIPDDAVLAHAAAAARALDAALRPPLAGAGGSATRCHAVGHAHIDTAWLWPLRETRRKCARTFSTVLRLMERFPEFRFLCSQAQQYAFIEEDAPELFRQIKRRVLQGRWEPGGAMWIEPDCTAPSGESLIRQIEHGERYWRSRFGEHGAQRFLYLPDTFGFPAQIPQIMALAGLDTFITNKLHWNSHTVFPHTTFQWRGLDGSSVVAHQTPGMDYNATNTPRELLRGEKTHKNKDLIGEPSDSDPSSGSRWLQPFGFGDGGGGPTDWSIQYARLAADCDALPRVRMDSVSAFCDALHRDIDAARSADPSAVPVHDGELYLELHRGTYTTHARFKQRHREAEERLRQAEILTYAGPVRLSAAAEDAASELLDRAWKLLLLNQFHDILPGSSITWVYEDAARQLDEVHRVAETLIEAGSSAWERFLDPTGVPDPLVAMNWSSRPAPISPPANLDPTAPPITADGAPVQPLTITIIDPRRESLPPGSRGVTSGELEFANEFLRCRFDRAGRVVLLERRASDSAVMFDACARGSPMNQLVLFEDRPRLWDAWDIDAEYAHKPTAVSDDAEIEWLERSPMRSSVRFSRPLGRGSRIAQTFTLGIESEIVLVNTAIDWREEHRFLRVLFPTSIHAPTCAFGTQFGHIHRATHRNTQAQHAMFEVPAHEFAAIRSEDAEFAVLAPDRFGWSCIGETIGLSLLRSPRYPDPTADVGEHRIVYGFGPIPAIAAVALGEQLRRPLTVSKLAAPSRSRRTARSGLRSWSPLRVSSGSWSVGRIEAITRARDGKRLIVRIVDHDGMTNEAEIAWGFPVRSAQAVDLLERPLDGVPVKHDPRANTTRVRIKPFQILTLAIERDD